MSVFKTVERKIRAVVDINDIDVENFDIGRFIVKDGEPMVEVIPTLEHRRETLKQEKMFVILSSLELVGSLTAKYHRGVENTAEMELINYQKSQLEDMFMIGNTDTKVYKNGTLYTVPHLDYVLFEDENKQVCTDNMLVYKILKNKGIHVSLKDYSSRIHKTVPQYKELRGIYRVKEISIDKLLHNYDLSTDAIRTIAENFNRYESYVKDQVALDNLDRFKTLLLKICDVIEDSVISKNGYLTVRNPITGAVKDVQTIEGRLLTDMINYAVKEVGKQYSLIEINEAMVEIDFIPMEEVENNISYLMDTYQIGDSGEDPLYVKDSIQMIHKHKDVDITVYTTNNKPFYTVVCGLPHRITSIKADIDMAVVVIRRAGSLVRYTINEDEYEEYGIFTNYKKCLNHNMSKVTMDILKGKLEEKEIEARAKKLEISVKHNEYISKINMLKELIKLTKENDKNALLVEKLKYEKSIAENQLSQVQLMEKQYGFGKTIISDVIRLAT